MPRLTHAGIRPVNPPSSAPFATPLMLVCALFLWGLSSTAIAHQTTEAYPIQGSDPSELICHAAPSVAKPSADRSEATELPSDDEIAALSSAEPATTAPALNLPHGHHGLKIALFGDSHLAAGFFSGELIRLTHSTSVSSSLIAATVDRPGVRLPLRRVCSSGGWRYEASFAGVAAAAFPGPGLSSAVAGTAGADLSFDLRSEALEAYADQVQILYHQREVAQRLNVSVDRGEWLAIDLPAGAPQPARVVIKAPHPISILQFSTDTPEFRFQGLQLPTPPRAALTLDVFGYPGATVMGFDKADLSYWTQWFHQPPDYDAVVLWFGTNEGNVPSFDPAVYESQLRASLSKVRSVFAQSSCILIGPGDRGVVIKGVGKKRKRFKAGVRKQALLKYALIHAEINQIQRKVGQEFQCQAFDAQRAMGGLGSAYRWSKSNPRKMAVDLIHFTPLGYRELADDFAQSINWEQAVSEADRP